MISMTEHKKLKFSFLVEVSPSDEIFDVDVNVIRDVVREELDELLSESKLISEYVIKDVIDNA